MSARPSDLLDSEPQIRVLIQIRELFLVYLVLACSQLLAGSGLFLARQEQQQIGVGVPVAKVQQPCWML